MASFKPQQLKVGDLVDIHFTGDENPLRQVRIFGFPGAQLPNQDYMIVRTTEKEDKEHKRKVFYVKDYKCIELINEEEKNG